MTQNSTAEGTMNRALGDGNTQEDVVRYLQMSEYLWEAAKKALPLTAVSNRREAVAYACLAAKVSAEQALFKGHNLPACLRQAAQLLVHEAEKLELVGDNKVDGIKPPLSVTCFKKRPLPD